MTNTNGSTLPQARQPEQDFAQPVSQDHDVHDSTDASIDESWKDLLVFWGDNQYRHPRAVMANVITALRHSHEWAGVLGFDLCSDSVVIRRCPPWKSRADWPTSSSVVQWTASDSSQVLEWMHINEIMVTTVSAAIEVAAREHSFHPIKEYLTSLTWDGEERIDYWLSVYMGVEPALSTETFGSRFLLSAVARVFDPGCKIDACLLLEGEAQYEQLADALRVLSAPWFIDELNDIRGKDTAVHLLGIRDVTLCEMYVKQGSTLNKLHDRCFVELICHDNDIYPPPLSRYRSVNFSRGCVFAIADSCEVPEICESDDRSFCSVSVSDIDIEGLCADRDQLWAEAMARYGAGHEAGEPGCWWLDTDELKALAGKRTEGASCFQ